MPTKKARIKDIAKLAGVSIGTVDRVLHKRGEVAEDTMHKVEEILKNTNYSPNLMAQALKSKKNFHLVSLLPDPKMDNPFWYKHPIGMKKAMDELAHFPITLTQVIFDMQSEKEFQEKANSVLRLKPDGILLSPIFKSESIAFCNLLVREKIPFVFIDGFIDSTDFLAYIGEDIYQSGRVAGQLIDIITPEINDLLIVTIARNIKNVHHLNTRSEGFLSYFNGPCHNRGKKIRINIPDPSTDSIGREMDKVLEEYPEIGSILSAGSRAYLISSYLKKREITSVNLVGYDLLDKNVRDLKSGSIRFLLGQRPEEQTYKGIKKLFEFLSMKKVPEKIEYLPVDIVTSENVDFFL